MQEHQHEMLIQHYSKILATQIPSIDHHALQIVKRLKDAHFQAYLVGGGVRDLLVDLKPKDFDIATNASPNEVKKKVSNCFIIGRRFKLVHARRGDAIYEIATFRRAATLEELETTEEEDRRHLEENFFGNIEEDSFRRDFTINSLYYDPIDHVIIDHCKGLVDIHDRVLRMIGSPSARLKEDSIRMLRAIRLSQKLGFSIDAELRAEIATLSEELKKSALPRRREEWIKFFRLPRPDLALIEMYDLNILRAMAPHLHMLMEDEAKRETFLSDLRQLKSIGFDLSDTTELFAGVLTSYLMLTKPNSRQLEDYAEDDQFNMFCRDEIGVFKAEAGSYFQAVQFIRPLQNREGYLKRGERRRLSLLVHPSFFLSLKIALLAGILAPTEVYFWLEEYKKANGNTPTPPHEPL